MCVCRASFDETGSFSHSHFLNLLFGTNRCADYVKHLMKTTQDKEEAVKKAKTELEMKERKLEEDKNQESRSDPESVTSSLTANTSDSSPADENPEAPRKRKSSSNSKNKNNATTAAEEEPQPKKAKQTESSASSEENGSEEGSGPEVQNISLDKMSSSVSDITDSNRGSSGESGDGKRTVERKNHHRHHHPRSSSNHHHRSNEDDETASALPSSSSVSSTAAVVRGAGSGDREHGPADVVIKVKTTQSKKERTEALKKKEMSSLDADFSLDYEEVFLSSNIPQLIATPAGQIVACKLASTHDTTITTKYLTHNFPFAGNDFFIKATGLSRVEIQRLTIFSIVQSDKLSNLFELVAEALRENGPARKPIDGRIRKDQSKGSSKGDGFSSNSGTGSGNESGSSGSNGSGNESNGNGSGDSNGKSKSSSNKSNRNRDGSSGNETGSSSSSSGHTTGASGSSNDAGSNSGISDKDWNYAAMTLPCATFLARERKSGHHSRQLYMTVRSRVFCVVVFVHIE